MTVVGRTVADYYGFLLAFASMPMEVTGAAYHAKKTAHKGRKIRSPGGGRERAILQRSRVTANDFYRVGDRGTGGLPHMPKITMVALPCNGIDPPLLPLATATSCLPLLL